MASTFLSLPREIRDQIYDYTCDWNNATIRIENIKDRLWEHNTRSTPNVLLLNRQITSEAVQRLRRKPLFYSPRSMISAPATYRLRPFDQVCLPMRLFGSATWQCVPLFVLKDTFFDHGHQHMSSFFYLVSSFHEASRSGWIHPAEFQMHFDIRLHRREDFDLNEYCNGRRVVYDLRKDKDGNHTTAESYLSYWGRITITPQWFDQDIGYGVSWPQVIRAGDTTKNAGYRRVLNPWAGNHWGFNHPG